MHFLLVDGNHLTGRCRATLGDLFTNDGRPSGVIHGFFRSLSYVRSQLKLPKEQIVVCWDAGRCEKRLEMYPAYKAGRRPEQPTPEEEKSFQDYIIQINVIRQALAYIGAKSVQVLGVEADDLLSYFAYGYAGNDHTATIYSGDHDLHQTVSSGVDIWDARKDLRTKADILTAWELPSVSMIPMHKALTGDKSDNISGIPQVGDVRARHILQFLSVNSSGLTWRPDGAQVKDNDKWVKLAWAHGAIVARNYQLMRLPVSTTDLDFFYSEEQQAEMLVQLNYSGKHPSLGRLISLLQAWNLDSMLENIHRWQ